MSRGRESSFEHLEELRSGALSGTVLQVEDWLRVSNFQARLQPLLTLLNAVLLWSLVAFILLLSSNSLNALCVVVLVANALG